MSEGVPGPAFRRPARVAAPAGHRGHAAAGPGPAVPGATAVGTDPRWLRLGTPDRPRLPLRPRLVRVRRVRSRGRCRDPTSRRSGPPRPDPRVPSTPVAREPERPTSASTDAPAPEPAPTPAPEPEARTGASRTCDDPAADADTPTDGAEPGDRALELPRIIAIANQKGGVGKTTTAVNLGAALAESGLRVLVVDLDPQGNASTGLGINPRDVNASIYDVLMQDTPALDAVEPTSLKNLFVIPATLDLAGAEIELVPAFSRELKLKRALDAVRDEYDVVLIDCPAVARAPHRERPGRRRRRDRADPVRVLRARGSRPAAPQRGAGALEPQRDARRPGDHPHDVRRPDPARRAGRDRGAGALRRARSTRRSCRGPCASPRRRRSASRSSCSTRRRGERRRTGTWRKR